MYFRNSFLNRESCHLGLLNDAQESRALSRYYALVCEFWTLQNYVHPFLLADSMVKTSLTTELHVFLYTRSSCMYIILFMKNMHLEWCFDHIASSVYNQGYITVF